MRKDRAGGKSWSWQSLAGAHQSPLRNLSRHLALSHTLASEEASTCSRKETTLRQPHRQGVEEITKGATGAPW